MGKKITSDSKIRILRKALFIVTLFVLLALPLIEASASLLDEKRAELNRLQGRLGHYENKVDAQAGKANTLKNQIALMNAQITQVKLRIKLTQTKIEETNLAIGELTDQISQKRKELAEQEEILGQAIKYIYEEGETPFIETFFSSITFSEILDRTEYLETAEMKIEKTMAEIERLKRELEEKKQEQEKRRKELQKLNKDLILQRKGLEEDQAAKNALLIETRGREAAYQKKVNSLANKAQAVQNEMARLEQASRSGRGGRVTYCPARPSYQFLWPSTGGITCDYYCYPGHTGVDFSPGTTGLAYAAASGTVVDVNFSYPNIRWYEWGYANYVKIAHAEGFYTLYAHLMQNRSLAWVGKRVRAGQAIGYIGTSGNSTGPHLHFEIRLGASTPTNPLCYY